MTEPLPGVALLAAALVPERAVSLLARHPAGEPGAMQALVALPGAARLERLAAFLGGPASPGAAGGTTRSGSRTGVRAAVAAGPETAPGSADAEPAWPVLPAGDVLPFDLPRSAPALAELDPSLLDLGARVARCAAAGLASVLGGDASVSGRLLPGVSERAASALVPVDLTAISGVATLAVERAFAARLAARVSGDAGRPVASGALSPAERAVLELALLGALDAIAAETGVERALAPRLALRAGAPLRPICIELSVAAAGTRGLALLTLPESALRALRDPVSVPGSLGRIELPASVGAGEAVLDPGDAAALGPGDVVVLGNMEGEAELRVAGGPVLRGRFEDGALAVTDVEGAAEGRAGVPVPVRVELARVSITIAALAGVAPGTVLPLGLDRSGSVTLRVGERAFARGELVDVDGAVGVRIGSLEDRP